MGIEDLLSWYQPARFMEGRDFVETNLKPVWTNLFPSLQYWQTIATCRRMARSQQHFSQRTGSAMMQKNRRPIKNATKLHGCKRSLFGFNPPRIFRFHLIAATIGSFQGVNTDKSIGSAPTGNGGQSRQGATVIVG